MAELTELPSCEDVFASWYDVRRVPGRIEREDTEFELADEAALEVDWTGENALVRVGVIGDSGGADVLR